MPAYLLENRGFANQRLIWRTIAFSVRASWIEQPTRMGI
jgi:hypothetical protein